MKAAAREAERLAAERAEEVEVTTKTARKTADHAARASELNRRHREALQWIITRLEEQRDNLVAQQELARREASEATGPSPFGVRPTKHAEAYGELAQRFGSADAVPKSAKRKARKLAVEQRAEQALAEAKAKAETPRPPRQPNWF